MDTTRRDFIVAVGAGCSAVLLSACAGRSVSDTAALGSTATITISSDYVIGLLGVEDPAAEEVELGMQLISTAPRDVSPIEIATYFQALTNKNKDGEPYNAEWAVRANPLIVHFFTATRTVPSGDRTAWCAAFVNFCLQRAGVKGSGSASSGTFRCWSNESTSPSIGDLVVLRERGSEQNCVGSGHVGFFVSQTDKIVTILGGNQGNRINEQNFKKKGRALQFHSIRSVTMA